MTAKNSKTNKSARKSTYSPEAAKAKRDAKRERKCAILSLEYKRNQALREMAFAVMNGDLSPEDITEMGMACRNEIADLDADIIKLEAVQPGGPRGFVTQGNQLLATFEIGGGILSAVINSNVNDAGFYSWTVSYDEDAVAGQHENFGTAIAVCRKTLNGMKAIVAKNAS